MTKLPNVGRRTTTIMQKAPRAFSIVLALLSAMWFASARAAEYSIEPSVTMRGEYSDNIRLTTAPHESVWGSSLRPSLKANYATETIELSGTGGLNLRGYSRESELNALDVLLNLSSRRKYATGGIGLAVDYVRDSTLASELQQTGLVLTRKQRDSLNLRPDWTWQITQRTALTLGYRFTDVSYQDARETGLVDYRNHAFSSALRHQISPRDEVSGNLSYQQYRPSGTQLEVDTTSLLLGYSRLFSETLRGSAGIGVADIKSRGLPTADTRTNSVLGNLSLDSQFEAGLLSARVGRDIGPSGVGGLTETDRAALEWSGKLRETLSFRLAGAAYRTRFVKVAQVARSDSKYYQLEPALTWLATRDWSLEAGYIYQWRKFDLDPSAANANTVYLNAIYNWPKQAVSR